MANLAFRSQTNGGNNTLTVSSVSAPLPAGTVQNDLMIIWCGAGVSAPATAPTISTPAGWTNAGNSGSINLPSISFNIRIHCFYKIAGASEGAETLSTGGTNAAFSFIRETFDNPDTTTPFGQVTWGSDTGTTCDVASMTTGAANALINAYVAQSKAQGATPPGSMTERADNTTYGVSAADEIQASAGATGIKSFTLATTADSAYGFAEFRSETSVGTSATTNANDTSSASGTTTVVGTVSRTNANDTSSASGTTTVTGTSATTNAADTSNASGSVGSSVTGTVAYTNANDSSSAAGTTTVTGTVSRANANDASAASGTTTVIGTSATTNAADTSSASGVAGAITGTGAPSNANDQASGVGSAGLGGGKGDNEDEVRPGWIFDQYRSFNKKKVPALERPKEDIAAGVAASTPAQINELMVRPVPALERPKPVQEDEEEEALLLLL